MEVDQKTETEQVQKRALKLKEVFVEADTAEADKCRVTVRLSNKGVLLSGTRTGPDTPDYKIMLTALCTIDALLQAIKDCAKMELLFIERQKLEKVDREIIMVLVDVDIDGETRAATGACQIKGNLLETAARAVLDATNRILERCFE